MNSTIRPNISAMPTYAQDKITWMLIISKLDMNDRLNVSLACKWLFVLLSNEHIRKKLADYSIVKFQVNEATRRTYFALDNNGRMLEVVRDADSTLPLNPERQRLPALKNFFICALSRFYVGKNGKVYTSGINYNHQMGNTHWFDLFPKEIPYLDDIIFVTGNHFKTFFLDKDGRVFVCGYSEHQELGIGYIKDQQTPIQVPNIPPIKKLLCDSICDVFLAIDGTIWVRGPITLNGDRPLNSMPRLVWPKLPVKIPDLNNIKNIYPINEKLFILNNTGEVWMAPLISTTNIKTFAVKIAGLKNIVGVYGSSESIFYLTAEGNVWSQGNNAHCQLGLGDNAPPFVDAPMLVQELKEIKYIAHCHRSTLFFDTLDNVWLCGENNFKEFGLIDQALQTQHQISIPVILERFPLIDLPSIFIKYSYMAMLDKCGNLYEWEAGSLIVKHEYSPLNFRMFHYYQTYSHLSDFNTFLKLAGSKQREDKCFHDMFIHILKSLPFPIRVYYMLMHFSDLPDSYEADSVSVLFDQAIPLFDAAQDTNIFNDAINLDQYDITVKFAKYYEYFKTQMSSSTVIKPDLQARLEDFIFIIRTLTTSDNAAEALINHLKATETSFSTRGRSILGFTFNLPTYSKQYHTARNEFIDALCLRFNFMNKNGTNILDIFKKLMRNFLNILQNIHDNKRSQLMNIFLRELQAAYSPNAAPYKQR